MPPSDTEQTRWFTLEVQPHEAALRAYLRSRFPLLHDCDDVIQETYRRLLREKDAGRIRHPRAFLFTAARNVALDVFRRRKTAGTEPITHPAAENVLDDRPDAAEVLSQRQELEILTDAVRTLPDRCRQVIMLRYLKGCSYKEIAHLLDISTETVKTQMATGVRRCTEYFEARGLLPGQSPLPRVADSDE